METLSTRSRGLKEILKNGVFEGFFSQRSKGSLDPGQLSKFRGEKTLEGRKKNQKEDKRGGPALEKRKKRKEKEKIPSFIALNQIWLNQTRPGWTRPSPNWTRLSQNKPELSQNEPELSQIEPD